MQQSPDVVSDAYTYILWMSPASLLIGHNDIQRKFMIILEKSDYTLYTQIVGTLGHILWNWLFVSYLGLGIKGTGLATTVTNMVIYGVNWTVLMR